MLDVITQAQIMALARYQKEHGTAYLWISHNRILCSDKSVIEFTRWKTQRF